MQKLEDCLLAFDSSSLSTHEAGCKGLVVGAVDTTIDCCKERVVCGGVRFNKGRDGNPGISSAIIDQRGWSCKVSRDLYGKSIFWQGQVINYN